MSEFFKLVKKRNEGPGWIDLKNGHYAFRFWKRSREMPTACEYLSEHDAAPFEGNPVVQCTSASFSEVGPELWCVVLMYDRVEGACP